MVDIRSRTTMMKVACEEGRVYGFQLQDAIIAIVGASETALG